MASTEVVHPVTLVVGPEGPYYLRACPHCGGDVQLFEAELACGVYRHGSFIATGQPIPPHASREQIDSWMQPVCLIYGCGRPFRFDPVTRVLNRCDYI